MGVLTVSEAIRVLYKRITPAVGQKEFWSNEPRDAGGKWTTPAHEAVARPKDDDEHFKLSDRPSPKFEPLVEDPPRDEKQPPPQHEPLPGQKEMFGATVSAKTKPATNEALCARIKSGDSGAEDALLKQNQGLVYSIARRYTRTPGDLEDLAQEGNIGLLEAARRFDPEKAKHFSTYANLWVLAKVGNYAKKSWKQSTTQVGGDDDESSIDDLAVDTGDTSPGSGLETSESQDKLRAAVATLPEREALAVRLRFGLEGNEPHEFEEIGDKLGISRQRAHQITEKAMEKLRRTMKYRRVADVLKALYAKKHKPAANQASMWGEEQEKLHPRDEGGKWTHAQMSVAKKAVEHMKGKLHGPKSKEDLVFAAGDHYFNDSEARKHFDSHKHFQEGVKAHLETSEQQAAPEQSAAKEPHEMTLDEWVQSMIGKPYRNGTTGENAVYNELDLARLNQLHENHVATELIHGGTVLPEVLADYPDLQPKATEKPQNITGRYSRTLSTRDALRKVMYASYRGSAFVVPKMVSLQPPKPGVGQKHFGFAGDSGVHQPPQDPEFEKLHPRGKGDKGGQFAEKPEGEKAKDDAEKKTEKPAAESAPHPLAAKHAEAKKHVTVPGSVTLLKHGSEFHAFGDDAAKLAEHGIGDGQHAHFGMGELNRHLTNLTGKGQRVAIAEPRGKEPVAEPPKPPKPEPIPAERPPAIAPPAKAAPARRVAPAPAVKAQATNPPQQHPSVQQALRDLEQKHGLRKSPPHQSDVQLAPESPSKPQSVKEIIASVHAKHGLPPRAKPAPSKPPTSMTLADIAAWNKAGHLKIPSSVTLAGIQERMASRQYEPVTIAKQKDGTLAVIGGAESLLAAAKNHEKQVAVRLSDNAHKHFAQNSPKPKVDPEKIAKGVSAIKSRLMSISDHSPIHERVHQSLGTKSVREVEQRLDAAAQSGDMSTLKAVEQAIWPDRYPKSTKQTLSDLFKKSHQPSSETPTPAPHETPSAYEDWLPSEFHQNIASISQEHGIDPGDLREAVDDLHRESVDGWRERLNMFNAYQSKGMTPSSLNAWQESGKDLEEYPGMDEAVARFSGTWGEHGGYGAGQFNVGKSRTSAAVDSPTEQFVAMMLAGRPRKPVKDEGMIRTAAAQVKSAQQYRPASGEQVPFSREGRKERYLRDLCEHVNKAAGDCHPNPSDPQRKAGNFRKGHVWVHGLPISIETAKGFKRWPGGPPLAAHYGYIKGTSSRDDQQLDVFVGPVPSSQIVFLIDHRRKSGRFDETKVLIGFSSREQAVKAYLSSYPPGRRAFPLTKMTIWQFKAWLKEGDQRTPVERQVSKFARSPADVLKQLYKKIKPATGQIGLFAPHPAKASVQHTATVALPEPNFTGVIKDSLGREQHYVDGVHVAGPQDAETPKPVKKIEPKPRQKSMFDDDVQWVEVNNTHVAIEPDGKIVHGPEGMEGKQIDEIEKVEEPTDVMAESSEDTVTEPSPSPWKLSRGDFHKQQKPGYDVAATNREHRESVEQALAEGKDVPAEAYRDYADLKPKAKTVEEAIRGVVAPKPIASAAEPSTIGLEGGQERARGTGGDFLRMTQKPLTSQPQKA